MTGFDDETSRGPTFVRVGEVGLQGAFDLRDAGELEEFMRKLGCCAAAAFPGYGEDDAPAEEPAPPRKKRRKTVLKPSAPDSFDARVRAKIAEIGEDRGALATALDSTVGVIAMSLKRLRAKGEL